MTKRIKLELTSDELKVLTTLADNQMFRMRFIDPKMPGYKVDPDSFRASQAVIGRLHVALDAQNGVVKPGKVAGGGFKSLSLGSKS